MERGQVSQEGKDWKPKKLEGVLGSRQEKLQSEIEEDIVSGDTVVESVKARMKAEQEKSDEEHRKLLEALKKN